MEYDAHLRSEQGVMSLAEVLGVLWWGKWIVALVVALTVGATALYIKDTVPEYTARMVVAPLGVVGGSGLSNIPTPLRGVATSLLDMPHQTTEFDKLRAVVHSISLAERLQKKHRMLQTLHPGMWDAKAGRWHPPPPDGWFSKLKKSVESALHIPGLRPPDIPLLAGYLQQIQTEPFENTPLQVFYLSHRDPQLAAYLLGLAFREAEEILRQRKIDQYRAQLDYVRNRIQKITVVEHRVALINLMSSIERQIMVIQANQPVAGEIMRPVWVDPRPSWPQSEVMLVWSVVVGLLLGLPAALLARSFLRQRRA